MLQLARDASFCALALMCAISPAGGALQEEIARSVDPVVSMVESGGYWMLGERRGSYRVIVTSGCSPEHCFDQVYLQWLETTVNPEGESKTSELKTILVPEAGELSVAKSIRFVRQTEQDMVQLVLANTYSEKEGSICLLLRPQAGQYEVKEGTCR